MRPSTCSRTLAILRGFLGGAGGAEPDEALGVRGTVHRGVRDAGVVGEIIGDALGDSVVVAVALDALGATGLVTGVLEQVIAAAEPRDRALVEVARWGRRSENGHSRPLSRVTGPAVLTHR